MMQKEMLFYYCNPTDDMQITIYTQKPGHDCWSWEAIYKGGSALSSWSWRKQVSRTGVGGSKQGVKSLLTMLSLLRRSKK
jgi:hypothetical protein